MATHGRNRLVINHTDESRARSFGMSPITPVTQSRPKRMQNTDKSSHRCVCINELHDIWTVPVSVVVTLRKHACRTATTHTVTHHLKLLDPLERSSRIRHPLFIEHFGRFFSCSLACIVSFSCLRSDVPSIFQIAIRLLISLELSHCVLHREIANNLTEMANITNPAAEAAWTALSVQAVKENLFGREAFDSYGFLYTDCEFQAIFQLVVRKS